MNILPNNKLLWGSYYMADEKGSIKVISNPSGAKIQLGYNNKTEEIVPATPYTIADRDPGTYTVYVTIDDVSNSKEVKVESGSETTVEITIFTKEIKKEIHHICVYTIIFSFILAAIAVLTELVVLRTFSTIPSLDPLFKELIFIGCAGGLGGLAYNMYVYTDHIGREEDFRVEFASSYYLRPFIGILYGVFVFFLVAGGLMTLSSGGSATTNGLYTQQSVMFYVALSFLAGYGEEPVSINLKALAEAMFKEPPADDKSTTTITPNK